MGINIFDTLYQMALDEMKETRGALKRMNREDHAEILVQTQIRIDELQVDYKALNKEYNSIGEELNQVETKISTLYESKTPLDVSDLNITALEDTKVELATTLSTLSEQIIGWDRKKKELKIESGSLSSRVQSLNGVGEKYEEMEAARYELQALELELGGFIKQIDLGQARLNHITSHEYDPDCDFCVKNNTSLVEQSSQISKDLDEMRQQTAELEPRKSGFEVLLVDYDEIATEYVLKQDTIQTLQTVERDLLVHTAKLSDLKSNITTKKSRLKDVNVKIRKYHRSVDRIEKNARIDAKIETAEQLQQEFTTTLKSLDTKLRGLHGKLQVEKASKRKVLEELSEMEELEQAIQAYEFYVHAVKRDGVPYELVSKVIPSIQSEVNNILSQIAEFTISLEVDGKNINGRIVYGDDRHWPLEMSSGMERFISSLAIRVALITVSNLPKPNFLIIDEGLGTLSTENLMSMHMLFSILKNQFDFMIIISHLEAVRDMVDSLMEIQLENGFSKINY
jgi:DNA repair exonuclease SbcCD ATPase subunit